MSAVSLGRTQCKVLRALSEAERKLHTRDLASRCGLLLNEVRWACGWLAGHGLIVETKRLMIRSFGDKAARRPVSFWSTTDSGRDLARTTIVQNKQS